MKLAIIGLLCALASAGSAHAYCKVKAPDGTWYYGDKCAQVSRQGMPEDVIDQSAPAVMRDLQESRPSDRGVQRQRLRGYEYQSTDQGGVRVREVDAADRYQFRPK